MKVREGGKSVAKLKQNHIIQKRNVLNEIRSNSMTLQELRFFSIYLSKINASDINTRVVRFPMDDFKAIMELGRIDIGYMKTVTNGLLSKVVNVPTDRGGYIGFQLFKECEVDQNDNGEWYVEIDAHDKALPLMFEFKNKYFTYQLWNALRLKSSNQLRMYEILKQYQTIGSRILTIEDLKSLLGIGKDEYNGRWNNFKKYVLDACQQALEEYTDIKFTYEPYGKKGKGGKILKLIFFIEKNENYTDQLTLNTFIEEKKIESVSAHFDKIEPNKYFSGDSDDDVDSSGENYFQKEICPFLTEACQREYNQAEIQVLYNLIIKIIPYSIGKGKGKGKEKYIMDVYDYLKRKYDELNMRAGRTEIKNRFGYLKKLIEVDANPDD